MHVESTVRGRGSPKAGPEVKLFILKHFAKFVFDALFEKLLSTRQLRDHRRQPNKYIAA